MEEQGGGAQEMAFVRGVAGRLRAERRGLAGPGQKPPCGPRAPPLPYQASFRGSLGCVCATGCSPCHTEDRVFSRGTHRTAGLPPPQRQRAQGRTRGLMPGRGAGHCSTPGGSGPGGRDTRPGTASPVRSQACALPGRQRAWLWLKPPTLLPGGKLGPSGFNLQSRC